jgi:hypothetical protein
MVLSLKTKYMSRLRQNRIIDNAIRSIAFITQNQCSLSDSDLVVVNEASERLQRLKSKKGKTNEQIRDEIAKVIVLLIVFFAKNKAVVAKMPNDNPNTP